MSFNPARAAGKDLRRKNRVRNPHAGIKQSTILAKQGSKMVLTSESQKRESTASGWKITEFKGKTFEVVFYYICARNSTGIIKNEKYDRSIRVLAGHVYLTTNEKVIQLQMNQTFVAKKGSEYHLATDGVGDVELLICQGPDYEKSIEQVTPPGSVNTMQAAPLRGPAGPMPERRSDSKAKQQAEILQAKREGRVARTPVKGKTPLPGQVVEGTNPRPTGAGGYRE